MKKTPVLDRLDGKVFSLLGKEQKDRTFGIANTELMDSVRLTRSQVVELANELLQEASEMNDDYDISLFDMRWSITGYKADFTIVDSGNYTVCSGVDEHYNAMLIASSPDLLEFVLAFVRKYEKAPHDLSEEYRLAKEVLNKALEISF